MKKGMIVPAVLACMLIMGGTMYAQGSPPLPGPGGQVWSGPQGHMLNMVLELNLTDAQKHSIAVMLKTHRSNMIGTLANMKAAKKQLFKLVTADEINEEAIRAAFQKAANYEQELILLQAKLVPQIRGMLTAEQKTTLNNMKTEMRPEMCPEMHAEMRPEMRPRMKEGIQERKSRIDDWIDTYSK